MRTHHSRAQASRHTLLLDTLEPRTLFSVAHKIPPAHAPKAPHPKHAKGSSAVTTTPPAVSTDPTITLTDSSGNSTTYSLDNIDSLLNTTLPSSATFSLNLGDILGPDLSNITGSYSIDNSGSLTLNLDGLGDLSNLLNLSL